MSCNNVYQCGFCRNKIKEIIKELYGKIPEEEYIKIKECNDISNLIELLPEEYKNWIHGDVGRIEGSSLDYDFFECWGEGVYVNEDGNMVFNISGNCDLCGKEFQYKIILPENDDSPEKIIDLTKQDAFHEQDEVKK